MSHFMKSGKPCGRPDGHSGTHRSPESLARAYARHKEYLIENRESIREKQAKYDREYYIENRDVILGRLSEYHRELHNRAVALYGDRCVCCGETRDLEVDHIYGGGKRHIREMFKRNAHSFYRWLLANHPAGFQVLCCECNGSKHGRDSCQLDHSLAVA